MVGYSYLAAFGAAVVIVMPARGVEALAAAHVFSDLDAHKIRRMSI